MNTVRLNVTLPEDVAQNLRSELILMTCNLVPRSRVPGIFIHEFSMPLFRKATASPAIAARRLPITVNRERWASYFAARRGGRAET